MRRLLRVSSFRAVLVYLGLFLASTGIVLLFLHGQINQALTTNNDKAVWRDAAMMNQSYALGGLSEVEELVTQQSQLSGVGVYLLADGLGRYIAGNVPAFPAPSDTQMQEDGWLHLRLQTPFAEARARLVRFDDNLVLLIGRDLSAQQATMDDLARSFLIALLLLAVFGVIGGGLMGRQALARVENINHSLRAIMSGDFSARIAPTSSQDELADLAAQINEMLARIETLMLAMREVTDNLAHDLRSPLTRLRGRLEKLSLSAQKTAQAEDIEQGLADIDQLLGLFTAVLNLSRMEAGTGDMQRELIGVKPLVDDVMELYQAVFEEAGWTIDYAVDSAAAEAHILGDRHLLAQALINLLENALIHGVGSASHLTVSLTRRDQQIIISVTDTGGGVAEDQLAHIRQRFVRLDESRSRPGNGLGLSLVDAICRRHGGHLHLSNHRPSGLRCEMCLTARE